MIASEKISVVIPAKNEVAAIGTVVSNIRSLFSGVEVIVVDDGSTDGTADAAVSAGAMVCSHPYSKGNGAAIKTGARSATRPYIVFMDGDGQHEPADIARLLEKVSEGYDLVIGARSNTNHASGGRRWANALYNRLSSWVSGHTVLDLTSGFRVVNAKRFREFLYLLPNGFSYPTTSTMAFFRAGYSVGFTPITAKARLGKSHIKPLKDGVRFLLIIFKIGTLYSPLKIFFPIAFSLFFSGVFLYLYNYFSYGRFTNMSLLLILGAIIVFLIGLISEQVTALMYAKQSE